MAVIGNSSTQQSFTPAVDYFSGNASTTAFTLSRPVASVAQVQVVVNNVAQNPSSAYTISSNTITFTSAPSSGTNNIYVYYTSPITQVIAPSQGSVNTTSLAGGTVTTTADATLNGLTVGKGGGAVSTNTAVGASALQANTTASDNTALGYQAGYSNTTGTRNVYLGAGGVGYANTTSNAITGVGWGALNANTGAHNTGLGYQGLYNNTSGAYNVAVGSGTLLSNTTASQNTAVGYQAGYTNSTGTNNTFIGYGAGNTSNAASTTGYNTAVGAYAGYSLTTGVKNTFIGSFQSGGTAGSGSAITTGSANSILGAYTGNGSGLDIRTSSNNVVLSDGDGNVRQVIDSAGNVGIGTTSPANRLDVSVTGADVAVRAVTTSANYATFRLKNSSQDYSMQIRTDQSNAWVLRDETAGVNRMMCITSGQVGINVTAASGNTFRVVNIGSDNAVQFGNASNGVYLGNGATSFSTYSDVRLKNITGKYETPLADIAKLDAIKFTWKNDTENKPCVGVSAQSVETVIPEAIDRSTNFNAESDTTEYLSVKYTELIPLMIASIQELKAINDTQAETINALTARIEALENK